MVRRPRLLARLHDHVHARLTLVVGAAGYGKTSLLRDFAADCAAVGAPLTLTWYTAAPWDADALFFLDGLTTAFRQHFPTFGDRTRRLVEQARSGGSPTLADRLLDSVLATFVQEATEHVRDYTVLVLDDYHLLDDSSAARRALEILFDRLPPHLHFVLLSRTVPSLNLGRLVLAENLAALGAADLAFTPREIALFLRQRLGIDSDPALAEELHERTGGWIAGLVLASPAPTEASPPQRLAGLVAALQPDHSSHPGGERLRDFLARNVFDRLSPQDQHLLLAAALPDLCDPADLDRVLDRTDSSFALARLQAAGLPLSQSEDSPGAYRLNGLLRDFLRARVQQLDSAERTRLAQRWGAVAESRGDHAAVDHYLAGGLYAEAARLLERDGERWIDAGRQRMVERWFAVLPPPLVKQRHGLGLCAARLAFAQGRHALAIERARQVARAARRDGTTAARALLLEAIVSVASGQPGDGVRLCREVLECPTAQRSPALLAEAHRSLGTAEMVQGHIEPALAHLEDALALFERLHRTWDMTTVLNNLGVAHEQLGRPADAARCHTRALALRRELGDLVGVSSSLTNLGLLAFYRAAYQEAETMFREALSLAESTGNPTSRAAVLVNLGDVQRAVQRPEDALASYRGGVAAAVDAADPRWHAHALAGEAAVHLAGRDMDAADRAARLALERAQRDGLREVAGHARITLAAVALAAGRPREAGALLDSARAAAEETGSVPLGVRAALWSGHAATRHKRWADALAGAHRAVDGATALGGPALLALEGRELVPFLQWAASRGVAPELIARALDDLDQKAAGAVREATAPAVPPPLLPAMKLSLLGAFAGTLDAADGTVAVETVLPPRSRVRELLVYLAVHEAGCRREEIGADLWPDAEPGQDVTLTYTTTHRLRQALYPELVVAAASTPGAYQLNPAAQVEIDVRTFEKLLRSAERSDLLPDRRRTVLAEAAEMYQGSFFPECYSEWAVLLRRRLERQYSLALAALARLDWTARRYRDCLGWCERLLLVEPDEEAIHALVLECYAALDEPLTGILHFRRYAAELAQQRREPSPSLVALYERLKRASQPVSPREV